MGGVFEVSIIEDLGEKVRVRVWYGRPTEKGWEPWDWDGHTMLLDRDRLSNPRKLIIQK